MGKSKEKKVGKCRKCFTFLAKAGIVAVFVFFFFRRRKNWEIEYNGRKGGKLPSLPEFISVNVFGNSAGCK